MGGALAAAYGLLLFYVGRFLYPRKKSPRVREVFVASKGEIDPTKPLAWTAPNGQKILIHQTNGELLALSNICPHLGCKVHWEAMNERFLCPCHQGAFDKNGVATAGPPKAEGKNLKRYDLVVREEAVYLKWEES
jgi:cytochrome b6-f complex iron-sulfur subunit